jgi:ADP-ribose pyrophosphatase
MKTMHEDRLDETELSSEEAFSGKLLHLFVDKVKLPNGDGATREYIKHPGAVGILPVTEDGSMVFVKQYRYPCPFGDLRDPGRQTGKRGGIPAQCQTGTV